MPAIILILSLNLTSICVTGSIGIEDNIQDKEEKEKKEKKKEYNVESIEIFKQIQVINSQNNLYYDKFFIKNNYNKDNYNKDTCSIYNKHLASSPILIPYKK